MLAFLEHLTRSVRVLCVITMSTIFRVGDFYVMVKFHLIDINKRFDKKAIWKYFLNSSSVGTNKVLHFHP